MSYRNHEIEVDITTRWTIGRISMWLALPMLAFLLGAAVHAGWMLVAWVR